MWRLAGEPGARDVVLHNVDAVGEHQTTNLGVSGSNPFGRAIFRDIPCDSHGNRTTQGSHGRLGWNAGGWLGSGAADYESGGQEFESLRARQHLAPTYRAKNTAILRNLQGAELAPILRPMHSCIGQW